VTEELRTRLSHSDFELFQRYRLEIPEEAALPRIYAAMDDVIFHAALEQGPKMFLVPEILQRVNDWPLEGDDGERRCKKLGEHFAWFSRIIRGLKPAPLVPSWSLARRKAIIREVKVLRRSLKSRFAGRRHSPPDWVLQDAAVDIVDAEPEKLPQLAKISVGLQLFVNAQPDALRLLLAGNLTPAPFADHLIGYITNYEPTSVAQLIRRLS
jgi:hypothetical protein